MSDSHNPWWRGKRGEWYVALQGGLILLVFLGPFTLDRYLKWPGFPSLFPISGAILIIGGVVLGVIALKQLRPSLTPSGGLKPGGSLVTSGPYRLIRHPVYTAQMLVTLGWSLALGGWLTSLAVIALCIVLIFKSLFEERLLLQRFPEYRDYKSHTRMFVPFIY